MTAGDAGSPGGPGRGGPSGGARSETPTPAEPTERDPAAPKRDSLTTGAPPATLFADAPDRIVRSPDGTPIAVFTVGSGPPVILVHGTTADHLTWRVVGPALARRFTLHAIDRRGRGASGDVAPYALEREEEDLAAVIDAVAAEAGVPVDVVGHSYGGRCGLGAALLTENLRRLVVYEGAPAPAGMRFEEDALVGELAALLAAGDREAVLETFMRRVVGMGDAEIATFRANPVWPLRVAAAPTIVRELAIAGRDRPERFAGVRVPCLLMAGTASPPVFRAGSEALARVLPGARVVLIDGAKHAAHHTHPERFVAEVVGFLAG